MIDADLQDYVDRVESLFFRLKGRTGLLSPSDFARARSWFEDGVPLAAVLEGVEEAFSAQAAGRDGHAEDVNSLVFCESFVERAIARRKSLF